MQFLDEVTIKARSGKWWDGVVAWRHEAGVPYGWPSGWNGGKWWSIILEAVQDDNTLLYYKYHREFRATPGESGRSKDQYGADAEDTILSVPVGTVVRDKEHGYILHHFTKVGEQWTLARGGTGGRGNMQFKDSVNQYPQFAILGEPWQYQEVTLELQLFADVALIGTPSVGKSSLINTISNTKAKVADYHFTTLIPHLWSVQIGDERFNVVDVPGLIQWAAQGKGLGNAFLRHILKTRVLTFVTDITRYESGMTDVPMLFAELKQYVEEKFGHTDYFGDPISDVSVQLQQDHEHEALYFIMQATQNGEKKTLMKKLIQFVINKQDLVSDDEIEKEYTHTMWKALQHYFDEIFGIQITDNILFHCTHVVSSATHHGIEDWVKSLAHYMTILPPIQLYEQVTVTEPEPDPFVTDITEQEREILEAGWYLEDREVDFDHIRYVQDPAIGKMVFTLMWGNDEAEMRFWKTLDNRGAVAALESAGVQRWDILKIRSYYSWIEDKYIVF